MGTWGGEGGERPRKLCSPLGSVVWPAAMRIQTRTLSSATVFSASMVQIIPLIHFPFFLHRQSEGKSVFSENTLFLARCRSTCGHTHRGNTTANKLC